MDGNVFNLKEKVVNNLNENVFGDKFEVLKILDKLKVFERKLEVWLNMKINISSRNGKFKREDDKCFFYLVSRGFYFWGWYYEKLDLWIY